MGVAGSVYDASAAATVDVGAATDDDELEPSLYDIFSCVCDEAEAE